MATPNIRPYTFTLSAGGTYQIQIPGDYCHVLTAPVNDLYARFDSGEPCPLFAGVGIRRTYTTVEFSSATGQTVTVYLGFGDMADGRATVNATINTTFATPNTLSPGTSSMTSGAATLIATADGTQKSLMISNPSSSADSVWIGDNTVAAGTGVELQPGQTLSLETTAAAYGYQNSGASITLGYLRLKAV